MGNTKFTFVGGFSHALKVREPMINYKIVADSSADLLTLSDVPFATVPLKIVAGEAEFVDDAKLNVSDMLQYLKSYNGRSGSACPNVGEWLDAFGDADAVFCVTITSGLSGSYNAASVAANEYMQTYPERRVFVVDSLSTGPESALLIEKLRDLILEQKSFEEIVEEIKAYSKKTHLLFALESLHNLANNGRVNPIVAKLAGLIGIRVVGAASAEGTLEIIEKVRGALKAVESLIQNMKAYGYTGGKVRIHHCENEKLANDVAAKIRAAYPNAQIEISQTRALCSFYAECGGLLVGYEG